MVDVNWLSMVGNFVLLLFVLSSCYFLILLLIAAWKPDWLKDGKSKEEERKFHKIEMRYINQINRLKWEKLELETALHEQAIRFHLNSPGMEKYKKHPDIVQLKEKFDMSLERP